MWFKRLCISCVLIVFASCALSLPVYEDALCITNISTIDANNGMQSNRTIVIQNNRIIDVVAVDSIRLLPSNSIVDGTDKYLIPGLWDTHVHFDYNVELAPSMLDLFFVHGITSVRDTGGRLAMVSKYKKLAQERPGDTPRVMIAGPLIDGSPNVYDGSTDRLPPLSVRVEGTDAVAHLIDQLDANGVDLLKAYEMLSEEEFLKVMEKAEEKGLPVTGHIPLSMDALGVSKAGINSLEHLRNLELSCASNAEELLHERLQMLEDGILKGGSILRARIHQAQKIKAIKNFDAARAEEILKAFAQNNTWQVPTMVLNTVLTYDHVTREDWRDTFELLPDSIAKQWLMGSRRIEKMDSIAEWYIASDWQMRMIKKIKDAKVGIMAGTDTPIAYLTPGYSLHEELILLVTAGLTPLEAIASATLRPAQYFSMESELGLIQKGYLADLIILDGNPLDDIANTKTIHAIIKDGTLHTQKDLEDIKARLKQD